MTADKLKTFDVLIEIPRGSRNKYEYDFKIRRMRFDRMLFSSMMYPADYGFIPETLCDDGDPLDVLVMCQEPLIPGCIVDVRPICYMVMEDEKGRDEKLLAVVNVGFPNKTNTPLAINPNTILTITAFMQWLQHIPRWYSQIQYNGCSM